MYPAGLAVPDFLKSTDADLYYLLRGQYDLQVVYCLIHKEKYGGSGSQQVRAMLCPGYETAIADGVTHVKPTKLVIPAALLPDSVLDYSPYLTADRIEKGEAMLVITGLRVSTNREK
jgi:hypothetical protein